MDTLRIKATPSPLPPEYSVLVFEYLSIRVSRLGLSVSCKFSSCSACNLILSLVWCVRTRLWNSRHSRFSLTHLDKEVSLYLFLLPFFFAPCEALHLTAAIMLLAVGDGRWVVGFCIMHAMTLISAACWRWERAVKWWKCGGKAGKRTIALNCPQAKLLSFSLN